MVIACDMRIHFLHVMGRKPRLHDGTVIQISGKNRLVEIPPRSGEPPEGRIDTDSVSTSNASTSSKEYMCLHVNCACARGITEPTVKAMSLCV